MKSYDLQEFNNDKVFTGEIDPAKIIPIKYQPYEKNSLGQTIIDYNKDNDALRYNISLNAKKISQKKFNQVIDIEFEEFLPITIDNTVAELQELVSELEAANAELEVTNMNDKSKINNLGAQIDSLSGEIITLETRLNAVVDNT